MQLQGAFSFCNGIKQISMRYIRVYLKTGNMTNSEGFFAC